MKSKISLSIALLICMTTLALGGCTRVDAGYEALKVKQYGSDKGVQDVAIVTGTVWYNPFTEDIIQNATFVQTVDYPAFTITANGGGEFTIDPTISLNIIPGKTPHIYKKYRKPTEDIIQVNVLGIVKDVYRTQMDYFTAEQIVSGRKKFETAVERSLDSILKHEGFNLQQLTSGLGYPQTIVDAVNSKNKAVQEAMRVENELRIAEAQAKKLLVQAEAEKRANELKQASLTPLLIQQQFIEKWDGKTPLYGTSPTILKSIQ